MVNKFCCWLDSNPGPPVSEATALPIVPQPLPKIQNFAITKLPSQKITKDFAKFGHTADEDWLPQ